MGTFRNPMVRQALCPLRILGLDLMEEFLNFLMLLAVCGAGWVISNGGRPPTIR